MLHQTFIFAHLLCKGAALAFHSEHHDTLSPPQSGKIFSEDWFGFAPAQSKLTSIHSVISLPHVCPLKQAHSPLPEKKLAIHQLRSGTV